MHGTCCSRVARLLGNFVEAKRLGNVFTNDTGFITDRDPDTVRGADVAYWTTEQLPQIPEEYITVPPDLAVEVLSPGDRPGSVREKLQEYFGFGVRMVWVVDPAHRTATVYRSADEGRLLHEPATLTGDDVLPGFTCLVRDLFP